MSWVKRNLFFLIGGVLAVVLLAAAGFYMYSGWKLNNDNYNKLEEKYTELETNSRAESESGQRQGR